MTRQTQARLYHLLPVAIWLLAIGGVMLWELLSSYDFQWMTYLPAVMVLIVIAITRHVRRHTSSVEACFQVGLLLGIASYCTPTMLFMILPVWGYLYYQNTFDSRSFFASLLGLALVAVWAAVLSFFWPDTFCFAPFAAHPYNWIPAGAVIVAWLASTIVRQTLRVR